MSGATDVRISHETLRWLSEPYHAVARMPDFPALSGFERWLRLREEIERMPGTIDQQELAALDLLDLALKSQILDWLEHRREAGARSRIGG